jgi:hypothetical protein
VLDALRTLPTELFEMDNYLRNVIDKIGSVDRDTPWEKLSGGGAHYGNIHDVCETLTKALGVYVPILTLSRHDSLDEFSIAVQLCGKDSVPNIFGTHGGALVIYEASNNGVPMLSHVDMLVPKNPPGNNC